MSLRFLARCDSTDFAHERTVYRREEFCWQVLVWLNMRASVAPRAFLCCMYRKAFRKRRESCWYIHIVCHGMNEASSRGGGGGRGGNPPEPDLLRTWIWPAIYGVLTYMSIVCAIFLLVAGLCPAFILIYFYFLIGQPGAVDTSGLEHLHETNAYLLLYERTTTSTEHHHHHHHHRRVTEPSFSALLSPLPNHDKQHARSSQPPVPKEKEGGGDSDSGAGLSSREGEYDNSEGARAAVGRLSADKDDGDGNDGDVDGRDGSGRGARGSYSGAVVAEDAEGGAAPGAAAAAVVVTVAAARTKHGHSRGRVRSRGAESVDWSWSSEFGAK